MTERISIAFLREQANDDLLDLIEPEDMHAIIDLIEAARAWLQTGAVSIKHPDLGDYAELEALQEAVARFDFDVPPRSKP